MRVCVIAICHLWFLYSFRQRWICVIPIPASRVHPATAWAVHTCVLALKVTRVMSAWASKVPVLVNTARVTRDLTFSLILQFFPPDISFQRHFSLLPRAGAMSDSTHRAISFYIILVGTVALAAVCGCAGCIFVISHLHRKRKKQQAVPQEEGINNQREIVNLIRNVDRPMPIQPPAPSLAHTPAPAPVPRCYEEIELTLPPSPAPSHPSPALKPAHGPKLDISNREREKLNTFRYTENQELEAWPLNFGVAEESVSFALCLVTGTCFVLLALLQSWKRGDQATPEEQRLLSLKKKKKEKEKTSYFVVSSELILAVVRNLEIFTMPSGAWTSFLVWKQTRRNWMIGPLFYTWCVPVPGCETKNVHSEYTCEEKKKDWSSLR